MDFTPLIVIGTVFLSVLSLYFVVLIGKTIAFTSELEEFKEYLRLKGKYNNEKERN